ncbi:MAG: HypC/HybG/HupF family hydrogenase formation chaperone, partial [Chloroflexota bacterium]|nr:HypC/HybG/HupF family hydrogenase formation chaperone [Chloroflexota bacterium]
ARVVRINGQRALVELGGLTREANITLVPGVRLGDYVLLHAGFAIQTLDQAEAHETLELLAQMVEEVVVET